MSRPDFTITADMARELAASARVCGRPMLRRVHDRATGSEDVVPIPCGSTREAVCPACARKARIIRMQQCTEGWHLTDEPDQRATVASDDDQDQNDPDEGEPAGKRVRSTRRRQDMPDLPRLAMDPRTVGRVFTTGDGVVALRRAARPSRAGSDSRPVPDEGPRPGQPRRDPSRAAVAAVVGQDRRPAQSRSCPGRPQDAVVRRHGRPRPGPDGRLGHSARWVAAIRVDRYPARPRHLRQGDLGLDQRAATLAGSVRGRHDSGRLRLSRPCGWCFDSCSAAMTASA